jgi:hypothetical protein
MQREVPRTQEQPHHGQVHRWSHQRRHPRRHTQAQRMIRRSIIGGTTTPPTRAYARSSPGSTLPGTPWFSASILRWRYQEK